MNPIPNFQATNGVVVRILGFQKYGIMDGDTATNLIPPIFVLITYLAGKCILIKIPDAVGNSTTTDVSGLFMGYHVRCHTNRYRPFSFIIRLLISNKFIPNFKAINKTVLQIFHFQ